jgi:hypothetical protein
MLSDIAVFENINFLTLSTFRVKLWRAGNGESNFDYLLHILKGICARLHEWNQSWKWVTQKFIFGYITGAGYFECVCIQIFCVTNWQFWFVSRECFFMSVLHFLHERSSCFVGPIVFTKVIMYIQYNVHLRFIYIFLNVLTNILDSSNLYQQRLGILWLLWGWQSYFNMRITGYWIAIGGFKYPTSAVLVTMFWLQLTMLKQLDQNQEPAHQRCTQLIQFD